MGMGISKLAPKKKLYVVTKHSDVMKAALKQFKIYEKKQLMPPRILDATDYEILLQHLNEELCVLVSLNLN